MVSAEGVIKTRPRWPAPPWHQLVPASSLAAIAWIRSGRSDGDPDFNRQNVAATPSPRLQEDLRRILDHLADTSRRFGVPVTVVAIPDREQIFGRSGFGFQEAMKELSQRAKFDYYDARGPFIESPDKKALFLPDWHFNESGNALLSRGLLEHLRLTGSQAGRSHPT
jgi:hypothetical protein